MEKERGRIVKESMGSFLDPPTYPTHFYSVETDLNRPRKYRGCMSLTFAVKCEWLHDITKQKAKELLDSWQRPPIDRADIQDWIHQVLGYFHHCYKGKSWKAEDLIIDSERDPIEHQDEHAGVHWIRRFYPEYRLTKEDLEKAYWGSKK